MSFYISNPVVNLKEKFILSFNADLSSGDELLGIGVDTEEKQVHDISEFTIQLSQGIIIDNGLTLLQQSSQYATDGDYIWRKDQQNNELLGYELRVLNDKVYEELKDISTYNAETDMMNIFISNNKVFKYIQDKYILDNGVIKLNKLSISLTTIFSFESSKIKLEQYHIEDHLHNFNNKLRFILNNNGTTLNLSKRVNGVYENIGSYFYSNSLSQGYIYLTSENISCDNLSLTYSKVN